jgi:hypothetical protein
MPAENWWSHPGMKPPEGSRLEPDYLEPYAGFKSAPSPESAGRLLRAVDPVIQTGLRAYGGKNANPILRSHAKRIAVNSFRQYDPMQGTLKNHLLTNLQGLQRLAAKQTQMINVPERVVMEKQMLDRAEHEMRLELGRDPSSLELADRTGLPLKRQRYIRGYVPGFAQGQVEGMTAGEEGEGMDPAVVQADPVAAKAELIYHDLDATNQAILEHSLGLHGRQPLPPSQIARRLNLTPGAISQRAARIQAMLDEIGDLNVF